MATVLIILTTVTSYFTAGYLYLNIATNYQVCNEITAKLLNHAAFPSSIANYQKLNHFNVVLSVQVSGFFFWEQEQKSHLWRSGCIFCGWTALEETNLVDWNPFLWNRNVEMKGKWGLKSQSILPQVGWYLEWFLCSRGNHSSEEMGPAQFTDLFCWLPFPNKNTRAA